MIGESRASAPGAAAHCCCQSHALGRLGTLTHLATGHKGRGSRGAKWDAGNSGSLRRRSGSSAFGRSGALSLSGSRGTQGTGSTRNPGALQQPGRGRRRSQIGGKLLEPRGRKAPGGGAAHSRGGAARSRGGARGPGGPRGVVSARSHPLGESLPWPKAGSRFLELREGNRWTLQPPGAWSALRSARSAIFPILPAMGPANAIFSGRVFPKSLPGL